MRIRHLPIFVALTIFLFCGAAVGQPGIAPPPGLVIKVAEAGRLLEGQQDELVWLEGVEASSIERFTSRTGREHVRFVLHTDGPTFDAIMYAYDWTEEDVARLRSGPVHLMGLWESYRAEPSFVAKWVEPIDGTSSAPSTPATAAQGASAEVASPALVRIEDARVLGVEKFVSRSLRMHASFQFTVEGDSRTFDGIAFEGTWSTPLLDVLRSGRATLVGYWDEYQDAPSFVLERVE